MCRFDPPGGYVGPDTARVLYAAASGGSTDASHGRSSADPLTLAAGVSAARHQSTLRLATGTYTGSITIGQNVTVTEDTGQTATATALNLYPAVTSGASVSIAGTRYTTGTGVVTSGESHLALTPPTWAADGSKMGIIYMHGATQTEAQMVDGANYGPLKITLRALAVAGYPIIGVYAAGDAWGNATAKSRIDDAKTYLQGTMGAKAGKIGIIGGSMGGLTALNWAKSNLSSVACAVGLVPVSDVTDMHTNNRGGLTASINTAYSTWSEATYGATYNPHTYAAGSLTGLRYKAWYGLTDTTVIPATVTDVVTAIGATASSQSLAGDHNTALNTIVPADVVAFFDTYQT